MAVSDELGLTAQPLPSLEPSSEEEALRVIQGLIDQYGVLEVVFGLPKNMNGSLGPAAEQALAFARQLQARGPAKATMWDERLTSKAAERVLIEADLSRAKRRRYVDQVAAVLILQAFLDRRHRQQERST